MGWFGKLSETEPEEEERPTTACEKPSTGKMRGGGEQAKRRQYVELDRDRIADIAQRHGVDEREALILYHLGHAFELYFEIAQEEDYGYDVNLQDWVDHHTGLINLLMRRVVRRDHPGGWRTAGEIIAMREAERQSEADQT